jgi:hypothetical protein
VYREASIAVSPPNDLSDTCRSPPAQKSMKIHSSCCEYAYLKTENSEVSSKMSKQKKRPNVNLMFCEKKKKKGIKARITNLYLKEYLYPPDHSPA